MIQRIVLVRQGTKYGPEYVSILQHQIQQHSNAEVICLTDQLDALPCKTVPLRHGWPGWWSKMELFSPSNESLRPCLYVDLDSFVIDRFDHLETDTFTMTSEFTNPKLGQSCVMWIPSGFDAKWLDFSYEPDIKMEKFKHHGDQGYLRSWPHERWDPDTSGIKSYKTHCRKRPWGSIIQFHGKPKQPDAEGWAQDRWNLLRSKILSPVKQPLSDPLGDGSDTGET